MGFDTPEQVDQFGQPTNSDFRSQLLNAATTLGIQPPVPQPPPVPQEGREYAQARSGDTPLLFNDRLIQGMDDAAKIAPEVVRSGGFSGFAKALLAGWASAIGSTKNEKPLNTVVNSIASGLGDAAAVSATPLPSGAGGLTGAFRTLAAGQTRREEQRRQNVKENQQDFENDQVTKRNDALVAESNARMVHEQKLIHQIDEQAVLGSIDTGTKSVAKLRTLSSPAPVLATDLDSDEVRAYIADKKLDPTKETAFPTGRKTVGENPDGTPVYRTTYTLMGLPNDVDLDPAKPADKQILDRLNKYAPAPNGTKWGGTDTPGVTPGVQHLTGAQFNSLLQQANDIEAATKARNQALEDAEIADSDHIQKLESVRFQAAKDGVWQNALASNNNDPIKALGVLQSNPDVVAKYPNLPQDVRHAYGDKLFDEMVKDRQKQELEDRKQTETERHNRADESNKRLEIDAKKTQAFTSTLTGDDYLQTLPLAQRGIVQAVGEGRQALPANRKEALAMLEMVHQAYPDYDETKGKTWSKSRNEYMGSGQTAKKVVSYNTALEHMQALYDHSTLEGLYVPGSKDYSDRDVALKYVAHEVGTAIKNGVMSQKEGEEILDSLKGWTPGTAKERVAETARLLHDKIDEYQRKFDESKPSSAVQVPILMSPKAGAAYDYVQSGGKLQPQQQQAQQQAPKGALGHAQLPNGTVVYQMPDGTIQDAQGNKYNQQGGRL
jgi:hypothetical protein